MSKYLRVMGLCFSSAIVIALIGFVTTVSWPASSSAQDDVCRNLTGAAYGLCNEYINAMKCGTTDQQASDRACQRVQANYEKITGELPPWDPCYNVPCADGESCVNGECMCGESPTCSDGEVCDQGQCLCGGVACSADETCEAGQCVDPCANVTCDNGETCVDGQCQCGGVQCTEHQDCTDGQCIDPCQSLADTAECPCDFESIPKTTECWDNSPMTTTGVNGELFESCNTSDCNTGASDGCFLQRAVNGLYVSELYVEYGDPYGFYPTTHSCGSEPTACNTQLTPQVDLTTDQYRTCLCRFAQYTTELSQEGFPVYITYPQIGMSFSCYPSD